VSRLPLYRLAGDLVGYILLFQQAPESNRADFSALRSYVLSLLEGFAKCPESHAFPPDDLEEARFALVAWADEMILRTDWRERNQWTREPLQLQLFGTNRAGNEFYEHLERLRHDQVDAREVYFVCLLLGFEGGYAGRDAERRALIGKLHDTLRVAGRALDMVHEEFLFPSAYDPEISLPPGRSGRIWMILFLLMLGALGWFGMLWAALRWFASGVPAPVGA
jgi:type VI secretion system protein ImpK